MDHAVRPQTSNRHPKNRNSLRTRSKGTSLYRKTIDEAPINAPGQTHNNTKYMYISIIITDSRCLLRVGFVAQALGLAWIATYLVFCLCSTLGTCRGYFMCNSDFGLLAFWMLWIVSDFGGVFLCVCVCVLGWVETSEQWLGLMPMLRFDDQLL